MSDFIDYVYCQGEGGYQTKHLFQTKAWSGIEAGNIVFAAGWGVDAFTVIAVITIEKGTEFDSFIRTMCEDEEVMWLTGKIVVLECEED